MARIPDMNPYDQSGSGGGGVNESDVIAILAKQGYEPRARVATTDNITLYGLQSIDGVQLVLNDYVLVKDQIDTSQNGLYVAKEVEWVRADKLQTNEELVLTHLVMVNEGSTSKGHIFVSYGTVTGDTLSLVYRDIPLDALNTDGIISVVSKLGYKEPVRVVSTENLLLTGLQTIDGISLSAGDNVLVTGQNIRSDNGIYTVSETNWVRRINSSEDGDLSSANIVPVLEGTTYASSIWVCKSSTPLEVGVTEIQYEQLVSGALNSQEVIDIISSSGYHAFVKAVTDTEVALSGLTVPSGTLQDGDRVLVNGQSNALENGIYQVHTGAWTRAIDADTSTELRLGNVVLSEDGRLYICTSTPPNLKYDYFVTFGSLANSVIESVTRAGYKLADVATTSNITLSGLQVIDTVQTTEGMTVLVKDQTDITQNGLYSASAGQWSRATGSDTTEYLSTGLVIIKQGSVNYDTLWLGGLVKGTTNSFVYTKVFLYSYVEDEWRRQGLNNGYAPRVRVATNGGIQLGGTPNIDGVQTVIGDLVLVKDNTDNTNGIYHIGAEGWTRVSDELSSEHIANGVIVTVSEGSVNFGNTYVSYISNTGNLNFHQVFYTITESEEQSKVVNTMSINGYKAPVRVMTTVFPESGGLIELDGVQLVAGDRILVNSAVTPNSNGIYVASSGVWLRASDSSSESSMQTGHIVEVQEGSQQGTLWICTQGPTEPEDDGSDEGGDTEDPDNPDEPEPYPTSGLNYSPITYRNVSNITTRDFQSILGHVGYQVITGIIDPVTVLYQADGVTQIPISSVTPATLSGLLMVGNGDGDKYTFKVGDTVLYYLPPQEIAIYIVQEGAWIRSTEVLLANCIIQQCDYPSARFWKVHNYNQPDSSGVSVPVTKVQFYLTAVDEGTDNYTSQYLEQYVSNAIKDYTISYQGNVASTSNIIIGATPEVVTQIDGVTLTEGMVVLLKDQTVTSENGLYEVVANTAGSGLILQLKESLEPSTIVEITSGTENGGKVFIPQSNNQYSQVATLEDILPTDITAGYTPFSMNAGPVDGNGYPNLFTITSPTDSGAGTITSVITDSNTLSVTNSYSNHYELTSLPSLVGLSTLPVGTYWMYIEPSESTVGREVVTTWTLKTLNTANTNISFSNTEPSTQTGITNYIWYQTLEKGKAYISLDSATPSWNEFNSVIIGQVTLTGNGTTRAYSVDTSKVPYNWLREKIYGYVKTVSGNSLALSQKGDLTVVVSPASTNALSVREDGLYVSDTAVRIDPDPTNELQTRTNGLYVTTPLSAKQGNILQRETDGYYVSTSSVEISKDPGNHLEYRSDGLYGSVDLTPYARLDGANFTGAVTLPTSTVTGNTSAVNKEYTDTNYWKISGANAATSYETYTTATSPVTLSENSSLNVRCSNTADALTFAFSITATTEALSTKTIILDIINTTNENADVSWQFSGSSDPVWSGNSLVLIPPQGRSLVQIVIMSDRAYIRVIGGDGSQIEVSGAGDYSPIGSIIAYGGNTPPDGYLLCDGSEVSRTTYSKLFAAIGTTYGTGNGSTTFNLPNLIDRFVEGSNTPGTVKEAGLPNITGSFDLGDRRTHVDNPTGAFYKKTDSPSSNWSEMSATTGNTFGVGFNATRSNLIYGNSITVQPPSVTVIYCIKYQNTITTAEAGAPLNSPHLTGSPTTPTPDGTNDQQIANVEYLEENYIPNSGVPAKYQTYWNPIASTNAVSLNWNSSNYISITNSATITFNFDTSSTYANKVKEIVLVVVATETEINLTWPSIEGMWNGSPVTSIPANNYTVFQLFVQNVTGALTYKLSPILGYGAFNPNDVLSSYSPALTGIPTTPTPDGTNTNQIVNVQYVLNKTQDAITTSGGVFTGAITVPTPTAGDDSTTVPNTAWVQDELGSYAKLSGANFTGAVTVPDVALSATGATNVANTKYVIDTLANAATNSVPITAPNPTGDTNVAPKSYVDTLVDTKVTAMVPTPVSGTTPTIAVEPGKAYYNSGSNWTSLTISSVTSSWSESSIWFVTGDSFTLNVSTGVGLSYIGEISFDANSTYVISIMNKCMIAGKQGGTLGA